MKTVNVRLVAILLVSLLVFGSAAYVLHAFQIRRNAGVFLREAERAEERDDQVEVIRNLHWYVRLRPDDLDAQERFGLKLADLNQLVQASSILEGVLRKEGARNDVRKRVVDIDMTIHRWGDARQHLNDFLLKEEPENAEYLEMLARCQAAEGNDREAVESFTKAIEKKPDLLEAYPRLAGVLRYRLGQEKEADEWMAKLVEQNAGQYKAHLLYATYLRGTKELDKAVEQANLALQLEPKDRDVLWTAARCALSKENFEEARRLANEGIKLHPDVVQMYTTLADVELRSGDRDAAVAALRRGLQATNEHPQLLWSMANLLIDAGQLDEASQYVDKLSAAEYPEALVGYLRSRIEFNRGNWHVAREGFGRVRGTLTAWPDLVKQVDYWMGKCNAELGNLDAALRDYGRATDIDPFFNPAAAAKAETLMALGRLEDAKKEFASLTQRGSAGGLLAMARAEILKSLRVPKQRRDWTAANSLLDMAEKSELNSVQIPILRAEILLADERAEEADALLAAAQEKFPKSTELPIVRAQLASQRGDSQKAEEILAGIEKATGDRVAVLLGRARLMVQRDGAKALPELKNIAANTQGLSDADKIRLWSGLTGLIGQMGDDAYLQQLCQRLAKADPNNIRVLFMLFEIAVRQQDDGAMQDALDQIEAVEGRGPFWLYGQAMRLSLLSKGKNDQQLQQALKYLQTAREQRPSWSRLPLLQGSICDQLGQTEQALKYYEEALDMGNRNPGLVRRLARLYQGQRRFNDAYKVIMLLEGRGVESTADQLRQESQIKAGANRLEEALADAKKVVTESEQYNDFVWLGQLLAIRGQRAKAEGKDPEALELFGQAEDALRRAVELKGDIAETWVVLIQFLSATDQTAKAEEAIRQAQAKIPAKDAPIALAQCYEAIGQRDQAQERYEEALAADPDNAVVVRYVADFYLRNGKPLPAETLLKRIMDGKIEASEADRRWARRRQALVFAARGGYQNLLQAINLIEKNLDESETTQDKRIKAEMLKGLPSRSRRREAIAMLEEVLKGQRSASPEDQFVLAQLYMAEGVWVKASSQYLSLLAKHGNEPRYVVAYIQALLSKNELDGAETWLNKLQSIAPGSFTTTRLRADLLIRRRKYDEAYDLLAQFVERDDAIPSDRTTRLRLVAAALESISDELQQKGLDAQATKFSNQAETLYREYVAERPEEQLRLAAFLARRGQADEALDIIGRVWQKSNPIPLAQTMAVVMKSPGISAARLKRAETIIQDALKQFDRPTALLLVLADVRTTQESYADAEKYYREIIKKNSGNSVAMNNLAVLLALQGVKLAEAKQLVDRAIEISGPVASMLDSRASVQLAAGKPHKALEDLDVALAEGETPVRLFHQAQAYKAAGQQAAALAAMRKAMAKGLAPEMLQPLERPAYVELKRAAE